MGIVGILYDDEIFMAYLRSDIRFDLGQQGNSGGVFWGNNDNDRNNNDTSANSKKMPQAKLAWILYNILGGSSLAVSLLEIFNVTIGQITFADLHEPYRTIIILMGICYAAAQTWSLVIKVLKSAVELTEKKFDLFVKMNPGKATLTTTNPDKSILTNDLQTLNKISVAIDQLQTRTRCDRVLVIAASNGTAPYRFVNVLLEQHKKAAVGAIQQSAAEKYKDFEFDKGYLDILHHIKSFPYADLVVETMPECALKEIYQLDGITHSLIYFLKYYTVPQGKAYIYYCSVTTHSGLFSTEEKSTIGKYINEIKEQYETQ